MKIKTKQALMKALRSDDFGYTGKDTAEEVLAWLETEKIKIDKDAVKALFETPASFEIEKDKPEEVEVVKAKSKADDADDSADDADDDAEEVAPRIDKAKRVKETEKNKARSLATTRGIPSADGYLAKAYDHKANQARTGFGSSDEMVQFNAAWRVQQYESLAASNPGKFKEYRDKFYKEDCEIIEKDASDTLILTGAALLANTLKSEVLWATEEWGLCRWLARNEIMVGNNTTFPRKTALPSFKQLSSGATQKTDINYDTVTLIPKQGGCYILTPMVLFEQTAVALGDTIAESLMEAYWNTIDDIFFLGDGTNAKFNQIGLIIGLTGNPADSGHGTASTQYGSYLNAAYNKVSQTLQADYIAAMGIVTNANWGRCKWVMSRQTFIQGPLRIATTAGTYGTAGGVRPADIITRDNTFLATQKRGEAPNEPHAFLMGMPVYFSQRLPLATTTANTTFAYFGDFETGTIIGHRTNLEVASSTEYAFVNRALTTRAFAEWAINICGDGRSSSTQCGPICGLATST